MIPAEATPHSEPSRTVSLLLDETIEALVAMDAAKLDRLVMDSERGGVQLSGSLPRDVVEKRRVLAQLLRYSKRNLRVLRRIHPVLWRHDGDERYVQS